ncbi:MAG: hypothetical protein K8I03_05275 [Ignavibacteria bacterium]|nr:hypothetical protein [Ignavibacteria bacterium]
MATTFVGVYIYNSWGYPLGDLTFEVESSIDQKHKLWQCNFFRSSKQRDKESGIDGKNGYDYFGARYYDSRIGRWGQVEPLLNSYLQLSPYTYSSCNPIVMVDGNGLYDKYFLNGSTNPIETDNNAWWEPERVFVQSSVQGSFSGPEEYGLAGFNFIEANDVASIKIYIDSKGGAYSAEDIVTDFGENGFLTGIEKALPSEGESRGTLRYIYDESHQGGKMDQKQNLDAKKLYLFDKMVYNFQEAGNIIWGGTLKQMGVNLLFGLKSADIAAFIWNLQRAWDENEPRLIDFDQKNEQDAAIHGYNH